MRIQTYIYIQQYDRQCSEHTTSIIYEPEIKSYMYVYQKLARICDGEAGPRSAISRVPDS